MRINVFSLLGGSRSGEKAMIQDGIATILALSVRAPGNTSKSALLFS
jgi:hypothetical protein